MEAVDTELVDELDDVLGHLGMRRAAVEAGKAGEAVADHVGRVDREVLGQRVDVAGPAVGRDAQPMDENERRPRAFVEVAGADAVDVGKGHAHGGSPCWGVG